MEQIEQLLSYPVHFAIAVIIVILLGLPIRAILDSISQHIKIDAPEGIDPEDWDKLIEIPGRYGGKWIGISDRLIFFVALWAGAPLLVAAWLAFKLASKWEAWTNLTRVPKDLKGAKHAIQYFIARTRWSSRTMQRFVVGTALNLLSAFIGIGIFYILITLQPCIVRC